MVADSGGILYSVKCCFVPTDYQLQTVPLGESSKDSFFASNQSSLLDGTAQKTK